VAFLGPGDVPGAEPGEGPNVPDTGAEPREDEKEEVICTYPFIAGVLIA
jgi:hypothetical protein